MKKITAIRAGRGQKKRVNVFLDGKFAFSLEAEVAIKEDLKVGQELTADQIAALADFVPIDFGTEPSDCSIADWAARTVNAFAGALGSSHRVEAVKQTSGMNDVDAALAEPLSPDGVRSEILYIGSPVGAGTATLGMGVQKTGRTSGYTRGTVAQVEATVRIDYGGRDALFAGQFVVGPMSQPGDSGSAVLDMDRRVVGLLFAGSDLTTVCNPIDRVLLALDVELAL